MTHLVSESDPKTFLPSSKHIYKQFNILHPWGECSLHLLFFSCGHCDHNWWRCFPPREHWTWWWVRTQLQNVQRWETDWMEVILLLLFVLVVKLSSQRRQRQNVYMQVLWLLKNGLKIACSKMGHFVRVKHFAVWGTQRVGSSQFFLMKLSGYHIGI